MKRCPIFIVSSSRRAFAELLLLVPLVMLLSSRVIGISDKFSSVARITHIINDGLLWLSRSDIHSIFNHADDFLCGLSI